MKSFNRVSALLMILGLVGTQASVATGQVNLALGKSYTLSPTPNYWGCTDAGDATQLTDGIYSSTYFMFWTQMSTVGWTKDIYTPCCPVVITIDLGDIKSISGASFDTAANLGSDVEWPEAIYILTSDDGQNFEFINDLVALSKSAKGSPPASGRWKYETHGIQTHGRYICLVLTFHVAYTFVDEIEVYEGDPAWITQSRQPFVNMNEFMAGKMMTWGVRRTMRNNINGMSTKINASSISSSDKTYINSELNAVATNLPAINVPYSTTFKAILPFNTDHERMFKAQAYYWNVLGRSGVRYWNSTLWGPLSPLDDPPSSNGASVSVDMMIGEYRAGAFNLSNATQLTPSITMTITGLPGGTNPSFITVHNVTWTDTQDNQPVAAALPVIIPVSGAYPITPAPGLTQQIWLTFHPVGMTPGSYTGQIQLRGDVTIDIPVTFALRNYTFPSRPTLSFGGWDYINAPLPHFAVTTANKSDFLAHLREHFVDSPWATSDVMPYGTFNANGNLTGSPATVNFNAWLADWPATSADYYYVFLNCGNQIGQFSIADPHFNAAVRSWINFWGSFIQTKGLSSQKFRLLLRDEPGSDNETVIRAWANAIRGAADRGFKIWEDPTYSTYSSMDQVAMNLCHILCPTRDKFLGAEQAVRDYYLGRQAQGTELQFYSCGGKVRLLDPYSYHRLQAWTCWKYGAKAMHFWCFFAPASWSSWNEYAGGMAVEYTPFFLDNTTVTPGKHMEACREGVEDYEYFVILKALVDQAVASGQSGEPLTRSQSLLATLPDQVLPAGLPSYLWANPSIDRTAADTARSQLLQAIVDLYLYMQTTSVQGTVLLDGYTGDGDPNPMPIAVRVELRQNGNIIQTAQKILDGNGQFTLDNVTTGTYDIAIKSYAHLQKVLSAVNVSNNPTILVPVTLIAGDIDGNNAVDSTDLSSLLIGMD